MLKMLFKVTPTKYIIKDNTITFWCNLLYPELRSIYCGTYIVRGYSPINRHKHWDMPTHKYKDTLLNKGKTTIRTELALINTCMAFCPEES